MSIRPITLPNGKIPYSLIEGAPPANPTLTDVLTNGNTTGGIDILGSSSNIETDALKCVSIRPLAFPVVTDIVIDGNLAMENNTNIDFGTDVDIQVDNQQVLHTDGSTNVIFNNVPRTNVAPAIGDDLTNKTYVDAQIGSAGIVDTIVAGDGISVDSTDPANPIVANTGVLENTAGSGITLSGTKANYTIANSGVLELTAGSNVTIAGTKSNYTINAVIPPQTTPSLAQVMDISSVASQDLFMNSKDINNVNDLTGATGTFNDLFCTPVTNGQISLNKTVVSSQALIANTYYINDNVVDIQTMYDDHANEQGIVFKIGSGSYGGSTLTINNSSNQFFEATSYNGSTITELANRGLTITNSSRIRFNGLQIEGNFTINGKHTSVAGTNCIFTNCEFLGASNIGSVVNNISGFLTFYQCAFTGALNIQPGTATIYFINCDFQNQVISNTGSPAQVIINNAANLNTLTQSAYIGVGTLASATGVAQISTNSLTTPLNTGSISSSQIEVASDPSTSNALSRKSYVDAQVATKVGSVVAGTAISVTGSSTSPTINNTGVTSLVAGSNITLSGSTGAVTISSTGGGGGGSVNSVTAGTGITVTGTGADPVINNSGVLEATAGTGISLSGTKTNYTIANTGIISVTAGTGLTSTQVTPGNPTLNNDGVLQLTAGSNIVISGTKANYTISSTGGGGGGSVNSVTAGTGITVSGTGADPVVNNDGVLQLTAGSGIQITGTKTNYTITNTGGGGGGGGSFEFINPTLAVTIPISFRNRLYNYSRIAANPDTGTVIVTGFQGGASDIDQAPVLRYTPSTNTIEIPQGPYGNTPDDKRRWNNTSSGTVPLQCKGIWCIKNTWFIATLNGSTSSLSVAFLRSTDDGATWSVVAQPSARLALVVDMCPGAGANEILAVPAINSLATVGQLEIPVYYSNNLGASWSMWGKLTKTGYSFSQGIQAFSIAYGQISGVDWFVIVTSASANNNQKVMILSPTATGDQWFIQGNPSSPIGGTVFSAWTPNGVCFVPVKNEFHVCANGDITITNTYPANPTALTGAGVRIYRLIPTTSSPSTANIAFTVIQMGDVAPRGVKANSLGEVFVTVTEADTTGQEVCYQKANTAIQYKRNTDLLGSLNAQSVTIGYEWAYNGTQWYGTTGSRNANAAPSTSQVRMVGPFLIQAPTTLP